MDGASSSYAAMPSPAILIVLINLFGGTIIGRAARHVDGRSGSHLCAAHVGDGLGRRFGVAVVGGGRILVTRGIAAAYMSQQIIEQGAGAAKALGVTQRHTDSDRRHSGHAQSRVPGGWRRGAVGLII